MEAKLLLNREAVINLLDQINLQGMTLDAASLMMCTIGQELHDITTSYYASKSAEPVSILPKYAHLRPTDEQVHRALVRLLDVPANKGKGKRSYMFHTNSQWLAVFKVLNFLKKLDSEYGCMSHMEQYIGRIFNGQTPRVKCTQGSLNKKNVFMFAKPLVGWEKQKDTTAMRDFWPVCLKFLQLLEAESITDGTTAERENK